MNGQPHVHPLVFDRQWQYLENRGHYIVKYGDTRVTVRRGPFFEARLKWGAKKAIRKHDRGSIRAQNRHDSMEAIMQRVRADVADRLTEGDQWPSMR